MGTAAPSRRGAVWRKLAGLRLPGSGRRSPECALEVEGVINELVQLNSSTEEDFLGLAGKLMHFLSDTRQISTQAGSLADLISGEQGLRAAQSLERVFERSTSMQAGTESASRVLEALRQSATTVRLRFAGFEETVASFRAVATLTRIEAARLAAVADFGHLADEVRALTENIEGRVARILEASADLEKRVSASHRAVSELDARRLRHVPALIREVSADLARFRHQQSDAGDASRELSAGFSTVSKTIERLVTAIQCHDITRQQVEHVIESLRRISSPEPGKQEALGRAQARVALAVQSAQLGKASDAMHAASTEIERDLETMLDQIGQMALEGERLAGGSEKDRTSFFIQMEGRFTSILDGVSECSRMESEISTAVGSLGSLTDRMWASLRDIQALELQLERLSLNTSIRAIHMGSAGDALNVVAETIGRLAMESGQRSRESEQAVTLLGEAMQRLAGRNGGEDGNTVANDMRKSIGDLHSAGEIAFSRSMEIATLAQRIASDLRSSLESFSAARSFSETIARCRSVLDRFSEGADTTGETGGEKPGGLVDFASHYTMASERETHAEIVGGGDDAAAVAAIAGSDLGENVELF